MMGAPAPEAWSLALVGLGSNLDEPVSQVSRALAELGDGPFTRVLSRSSLYRSLPVGPSDQPDYVNAVAMLETKREPLGLLSDLMAIERAHGRVRDGGPRWGPRVLDLDLLTFADVHMVDPRLRLPHPEIAKRSFVLFPLLEIVGPSFEIPRLGQLGALCSKVSAVGLSRLVPDSCASGSFTWAPV